MDVLRLKTHDTMVELKLGAFHERKLKRWWGSFSYKDRPYIQQFLGDATSIFRILVDWHLLEAIAAYWDLTLRCITIGGMDLIPTLEEYGCLLSLSTSVSRVYRPPTRTCFCKQLAELLGLKTPVVVVLT